MPIASGGRACLLGAWLLAASSVARAAECTDPYPLDAMLEDLVAVETFLRNGDDALAGEAGAKLEAGFPCMPEVVPRMIVGRAIRAMASGLVASGEVEKAEDWFRTAAELEQSFDFGLEDMPESHPIRDVYSAAKSSSSGEEVLVAGATLATGTAYLDGRKLLEPKARLDRWHLFQFDAGSGAKTWLIEGNDFPDEVLVLAAPPVVGRNGKTKELKTPKPAPVVAAPVPAVPMPAARTPKPAMPPPVTPPSARPGRTFTDTGNQSTMVVERQRPWEKTPLLVGGGTIVAGGAAVYYASYVARQKFDETNDVDELEPLQSRVNRLAIASMAILAVGAGTVTWGVILDGSGPPLPSIRIRF